MSETEAKPVKKWIILENLGELNKKTLDDACTFLATKNVSIAPDSLRSFLYRELPQGSFKITDNTVKLLDLPENILPLSFDRPGELTRAKNTGVAYDGRLPKSYTEPRD